MSKFLTLFCAFTGIMASAAQSTPATIAIFDPVVLLRSDSDNDPLLVRVTAPAVIRGAAPVIILSHGAYLSRSDYQPLVNRLARAGYVILQPDHNDASIDGFRPKQSPPPDLWHKRIIDLHAVVDALENIEAKIPYLTGKLDTARLFAVGHSYGGHSVSALMGAAVWNDAIQDYQRFDDIRIKAAVLIAPPGGGKERLNPDWQRRAAYLDVNWQALRGPVLVIVGEKDDSTSMSFLGAKWHEDSYRQSEAPDICLMQVKGVSHYLGGISDPRLEGVDDDNIAAVDAVVQASQLLFQSDKPLNADSFDIDQAVAITECHDR